VRLKRHVRAEMAGIYIRKNIDRWIGRDTVVASLHIFAVILRFRVFRMVVETSKAFEVESSSMVDNGPGTVRQFTVARLESHCNSKLQGAWLSFKPSI
jgi:hypothetical protein